MPGRLLLVLDCLIPLHLADKMCCDLNQGPGLRCNFGSLWKSCRAGSQLRASGSSSHVEAFTVTQAPFGKSNETPATEQVSNRSLLMGSVRDLRGLAVKRQQLIRLRQSFTYDQISRP